MKKLFSILAMTTLLFSVTQIQVEAKRPSPTPTPSTPLVCIDPGHGGTDPGATMTGANGTITEAEQNLLVAQDLEADLTAAGIPWVATRQTNDQSLSNADRYNFCNSQGATLELSIHMNGSTDHSIDYTSVLYGKRNKDTEWAVTVDNAMEQLSSATSTDTIQNNGITSYADGVLLKSNMPAALAETVFISSTDEYNLLTDGTGNRQNAIATQLSQAVQTWLASH